MQVVLLSTQRIYFQSPPLTQVIKVQSTLNHDKKTAEKTIQVLGTAELQVLDSGHKDIEIP